MAATNLHSNDLKKYLIMISSQLLVLCFPPNFLLQILCKTNMESAGMSSGGGHIQNGRHFKFTFVYISLSDTGRSMILLYIPMYSRAKNSIKTIIYRMFQNGRDNNFTTAVKKSVFAHKSEFEVYRSIILVSASMFSLVI